MTRPLLRSISLMSAIIVIALTVATAPQVRACKNSDKNPTPCSTPSPETDASLMFAASTPSTSIPDLNSDAVARTQPVQFGPENVVRPTAKKSAPKTATRTASANATRTSHETTVRAEQHPAASAEAKKPAEANRWTASAPRASESASRTIVSRPHRMPGPEIF